MAKKLIDILNDKHPGLDQKAPAPTLMQILDRVPGPTKREHRPPDVAPPTPDAGKPTVRPRPPRTPGFSY